MSEYEEVAGLLAALKSVVNSLKEGLRSAHSAVLVGSGQQDAGVGDLLRKGDEVDDDRKPSATAKQLNRVRRDIVRRVKKILGHVKKAVHGHKKAQAKRAKSRRVKGAKDAADAKQTIKYGASKKATRDLSVRGKLDNKPMTKQIKKGASYKTARVRGKVYLSTRGQRGRFVVAPADAGKL